MKFNTFSSPRNNYFRFIQIVLVVAAYASTTTTRIQAAEKLSELQKTEIPFQFTSKSIPRIQTQSINWNTKERSIVLSVLRKICSRAPGLIDRASNGRVIYLVRVRDLGVEAYAGSSDHVIYIPDIFFNECNRSFLLCHELVHIGDPMGISSFSKDWIQFADNKINKIKEVSNLLTDRELKLFGESLRKSGFWPYLYSCKDLHEAYADYLSEYFEATEFSKTTEYRNSFAEHFLNPSTSEIEWMKLYSNYSNAADNKNKEASTILDKMKRLNSRSPEMLKLLTRISMKSGESNKNTLALIEDLLKCLENRGISKSNEEYIEYSLQAANLLMREKKFESAHTLLSNLVELSPNNLRILLLRAKCRYMQAKYASSLEDFIAASYTGKSKQPKVSSRVRGLYFGFSSNEFLNSVKEPISSDLLRKINSYLLELRDTEKTDRKTAEKEYFRILELVPPSFADKTK